MTWRELLPRAITLHQSGQYLEAEALYTRILRECPTEPTSLHLFGVLRLQQGRNAEAKTLIQSSLSYAPNAPDALSNYGLVLKALGQLKEALKAFDQAILFKPDYFEAWNNRASVLTDLKQLDDALVSADRALMIRQAKQSSPLAPVSHAKLFETRGIALNGLHRHSEALAAFDQAVRTAPFYPEAWNNRGSALFAMMRNREALASYDKAIELKPSYADAHYNRGNALRALGRFKEACASYTRANEVNPDHPYAIGALLESLLDTCDWKQLTKGEPRFGEALETGKVVTPFIALAYSDDQELHRRVAENYVRHHAARPTNRLCGGQPYNHDKIRLAYLSADFHEHATAYLAAELFECHDRSRFEVHGISYGPDDGSQMRVRLANAFDQFHDVAQLGDYQVAKFIRDMEVDIVIDLKGYTRDGRSQILVHRPAPTQVNYLGYPGTLGAEFIDYVIADKIVAPPDQAPHFSEKIIYLPGSYQVNDSKRTTGTQTLSRKEYSIPDDAFVFCNFNQSYKLSPAIFALWMALLGKVDDSVLWLLESSSESSRNLRDEAERHAINPARLIFAPKVKLEHHLARIKVADLFLDTVPYNAHTTASDALWVGLPVLTCRGRSFAGRVAASLLEAIGLPELVADSLQEYETLGLQLATDPTSLRTIRQRLRANRSIAPLFDTQLTRKCIEAAYLKMWEIHKSGDLPRSFCVLP
jgi:protein O-GlcNAc transferase